MPNTDTTQLFVVYSKNNLKPVHDISQKPIKGEFYFVIDPNLKDWASTNFMRKHLWLQTTLLLF